jgi:ribonuclease HI
MFKVYTDGACKKNGTKGAKGGWAYAIYDEEGQLMLSHSAHEEPTTNQRMEIMAILQACKMVQILNAGSEIYACDIHSDSAYCIRCYAEKWYERWEANGWKTANREKVKNQDLWEQLIPFFRDPRFHFIKVRGHAGCRENNYVDELAQRAAVIDPEEEELLDLAEDTLKWAKKEFGVK